MSAQTDTWLVFLQHGQTKLFLAANNDWTTDSLIALQFQSSVDALRHVMTHKLEGLQIVFRFDTAGTRDVVLPIS